MFYVHQISNSELQKALNSLNVDSALHKPDFVIADEIFDKVAELRKEEAFHGMDDASDVNAPEQLELPFGDQQ